MHTTNCFNTFIETAEDTKATQAEVPPKKEEKTIAQLQFDMVYDHPYAFTSDDVIFEAYAYRNQIPQSQKQQAREQFFSKGQACMRASALGKRYGWGVHANEQGKIALVPMESEAYAKFASDAELKHTRAMRSSRK
ncbi:hypothetical protein HUK80_15875 [Flavobacterium sp. MAH-1]|uniref:Uncharacterized protein n=1 Tax=Flavobacterium agri TaxID=2743471 RepID=A0A7Y9C8E9_9FLAO|nr:DUF6157 family protein [Flavobacterium agri]NUY82384.1 hypothetical protein [Flavobacterium agri]NYA72408.1 hypothetical protein [Flavobacterium agri]